MATEAEAGKNLDTEDISTKPKEAAEAVADDSDDNGEGEDGILDDTQNSQPGKLKKAASPDKTEATKAANKVVKEEKVVQLRLTKKTLIAAGVVFGLLILSGAAYWLGWFKSIQDRYNTASVTLKIKEDDKYELEGAELKINGKSYQSGTHGKITLSLVAGTYDFILSKDGYTSLKNKITLRRGDNDLQTISISKLPDKLFTVKGNVQDYLSGQALANVQVTLGSVTLKTDANGAYSFEKVPGGDFKLVFSKAGYKGYELELKAQNEELITNKVPLVPSGQVVFVSNADGKRGIYAADYNGSNRRSLITPENSSEDFAPKISPDNRWVAFSSTRDRVKDGYGNDLVKLYIVDMEGKNLKKVSDDLSSEFAPTWSPDGQRLYFSGYTSSKQEQSTYKVYDVSKGTTLDIGEEAGNMVFSPNGNLVAYTAAATEERVAATPTPDPSASTDPSASPSATPTVTPEPVATSTMVSVNNLKLINLSSGERKNLAKRDQYLTDLRFGSDSKSVSYEVIIEGSKHRFEVNLENNSEIEISVLANSRRVYVMAPDGKSKVFIEERDGKKDLFLVDKDNNNEKRLTTLGFLTESVEPHWDESSRYISFAVKREGENAIYLVAVSGGEPKKVTDFYAGGN